MPVWFSISPAVFLGALMALTGVAALIERISRHRRTRALRSLAAQWRMTYSPHDLLRIAPRIASVFPVPGAADVYVVDLIYGTKGDEYRYVFTAEYTTGVIRGKRRQVRAATFCEPRGRDGDQSPQPVSLAPGDLPLLEQYRRLAPLPLPVQTE